MRGTSADEMTKRTRKLLILQCCPFGEASLIDYQKRAGGPPHFS